jgi:hypothetical protein
MRLNHLVLLTLLPLLAACGTQSTGKVKSASAAVPPTPLRPSRLPTLRKPVRAAPPMAQALALPGLESVIGASAAELTRQFGPARLDMQEGDARKLQFAGAFCVMDVYLYPSAAGREPAATYVDARQASDGKDIERTACITALRQRQ